MYQTGKITSATLPTENIRSAGASLEGVLPLLFIFKISGFMNDALLSIAYGTPLAKGADITRMSSNFTVSACNAEAAPSLAFDRDSSVFSRT